MKRPLLVIDGDSLAHRAYHALPKTIRRAEGKPSNAIVGFTNFLLRLWDAEQPRAVVVGWDTLEVPTYRHEALEAYQSGREFDDELLEQLGLLPQLVDAFGFASAKAPGYEADDFLAAAVAAEEKRGGTAVVATSDRDSFQLASARKTIIQAIAGSASWPASAPTRGGSLRRRTGPGGRLHRPPRRSLRPHSGRSWLWAEEGGRSAAPVRLARGGNRRRPVLGDRGGTAALPSNRVARRLRPPPSPQRPDTYLGGGVLPPQQLGHERGRGTRCWARRVM